jgi:cyanamide hydratase
MAEPIDANGWTPVPRSMDQLLAHVKAADTMPYTVDEIAPPTSRAAKAAEEYAKGHLPRPTFNHSMRVFYYGSSSAAAQPLERRR